MAYVFELSSSQAVYLENQGMQTVVTTVSGTPGQQQQAGSTVYTGLWTSPPCAYRTPNGVVLQLQTEQGEHYIQVQGNSMTLVGGTPSLEGSQQVQLQQISSSPVSLMKPMEPMKPMQPMEPMKPMQMGNMQMNMNPMEMRMGDMELRMGSSSSSTRQFCSQCGTTVKPDDRFCSSCGHRLN